MWLVPGPAHAQLTAGEPAAQFELTDWVTGVTAATDIAFLADGRAVVTRKTGEVVLVSRDGTVLLPMAARFQVDRGDETGLLGVVRDEAGNLYFYATTGADFSDKHRVYKATVAADGSINVDLATPIVSGGLSGSSNHVGGGMIVYRNQLYIGVGDAGLNRTPPLNQHGECLNKANGKILRVDLGGGIPGDNPLIGLTQVTGCATPDQGNFSMDPPDRRIFAWGLRNPWRFWIDPDTSLLWIGDVGEEAQEEITVGGKGANHGWPFNEGTIKYSGFGGVTDCRQMVPPTDCVAPQVTYDHSAGEASVTGGLAPPRGCGWGAYEQRYFFGDFVLNTVWTVDLEPDRSGAVAGSRKPFATLPSPVSFRMGADNALYVVSHGEGSIKRIAPRMLRAACQASPAPDAAAPVDAPSGGMAGGGGSSGAGGGGSAGTSGTGGRGADASASGGGGKSGGCSCRAPGGRPPGYAAGGSLMALIALALLGRRSGHRHRVERARTRPE
jgi:glucose/arabinose dehydrogenase